MFHLNRYRGHPVACVGARCFVAQLVRLHRRVLPFQGQQGTPVRRPVLPLRLLLWSGAPVRPFVGSGSLRLLMRPCYVLRRYPLPLDFLSGPRFRHYFRLVRWPLVPPEVEGQVPVGFCEAYGADRVSLPRIRQPRPHRRPGAGLSVLVRGLRCISLLC